MRRMSHAGVDESRDTVKGEEVRVVPRASHRARIARVENDGIEHRLAL
jgi:hypothetical protein